MLSATDVDMLAGSVSGPVLTQEHPDYADEVRGYNLAITHEPDVVVGAASSEDVVAAVAWARSRKTPVGVQATGHGAGEAVRGGLLITTRRMQDLQVDPVQRTARVGAGVRWKTVLAECVPQGLIGLNGSSTDVGVIGYTLGGGLPVLGRAYGFAADRVRSFEVVTPDGELRHIDGEHEPDLFALLRGGKGNLAIVTSMVFDLVPVSDFYGGGIIFPGGDAEEVLSAFRAWWPTLPDEACPSVSLLRPPDAEFVPEPLRGQFVVHVRFAFPGARADAEALLAPMRAVSTPIMDMAGPMNYVDVDMVHLDPPDPLPYAERGALLREFDAEAQATLLRMAGPESQSPLLFIELRPLGGALARNTTADAVSGRDAGFSMLSIGLAVPPIAQVVDEAGSELLAAMAPYSTGFTMVNFHGKPGDDDDRARAWSRETYERLLEAKQMYDPENMLRFGHALPVRGVTPVEEW